MRTFIIRLHEDAGGGGRAGVANLRLRGVVDEVATGLRATFRNDQELVTALIDAVGADPPGPPWGGGDGASRPASSDRPQLTIEEK